MKPRYKYLKRELKRITGLRRQSEWAMSKGEVNKALILGEMDIKGNLGTLPVGKLHQNSVAL